MLDIISIMIILGVILILGFIGNFIFNRTQIPSIVWLLFFGLIVGIIFRVRTYDPELLMDFSRFFAAIAIVIILFDGGINIDLYQLFRGAPRGLLLSISGFLLSVVGTTIVVVLFSLLVMPSVQLQNSVIVGLILGAIIGGTSSPIVIPLACKLRNLQEKTKMALSIESIITDPLCIVVVVAAFFMISTDNVTIADGLKSLVGTFSVGLVVGVAVGFLWLPIMNRVRKEQFSYILTLAVAFILYALTESWGQGSGAISCLMFGLVLGNGKKVLKMVKYKGKGFEMDEETKHFHSLISFVVRTFFFVYLGMMVGFQKVEYVIFGISILIALMIFRFIAIHISTFKGGFEKDDRQTMIVMMPRGLAAAILAINFGPIFVSKLLPYGMDGFFEDITFVVILGTAILCTIGVSIISYYEKKKLEPSSEK